MGRTDSARFRGLRAAGSAMLALVAFVLPAAAFAALKVEVEAPVIADSSDAPLLAVFRLTGVLDDESSPLGEGVPATLSLVVDLWRVRSGWWDALAASQSFAYRFRRDPGRDVFVVQDPDRSRIELTTRDALREHLERRHEVALGPAGEFPAGERYYLVVTATLRPLSLDDLEEVDAWLSGDLTEGRGGGLLGIPRALAGIVVDLSGLGDRSAQARSAAFLPRPKEVSGR